MASFRYVARLDRRNGKGKYIWTISVSSDKDTYGLPPGGPYWFMNYTACRKAIDKLERGILPTSNFFV